MIAPLPAKTTDLRWSLGDALDFECEADAAKVRAPDDLKREGDAIRKALGSAALENIPSRTLFGAWLDLRRAESPRLPGAEMDRAFRMARALMWIAGGLLGVAGSGGYLHYFGKEPVNVFWYLFLMVALPLALSGLAVAVAFAVQDQRGPGALGRHAFRLISRLSARKRQAWEIWSGMSEKHVRRFLPLAKWPLLGLTQRFACAFGAGALLTLLARVVFTDIAFGWQSTIGSSPEAWHSVSRILSAPWTWAFSSGVPSLEQVRASQFTHIGGMSMLDPEATRAWWPFIAGCIAVYSVALRGVFIALLGWKGRRALALIRFDHSDAYWLRRNLAGPLFPSDAQPPSGKLSGGCPEAVLPHAAGTWLALYAEGADAGDAALKSKAEQLLGGTIVRSERVEIDFPPANTAVIEVVRNTADPIAIVIPASTDPIEGIRKTLAQITSASAGRECLVLLHGESDRLPLWRRWAEANRLDIHLAALAA